MPTLSKYKNSFIVILCFLAARYSKYLYALIFGRENWLAMDINYSMSLMLLASVVFCLLAIILITGKFSFVPAGLNNKFYPDFLMGLLFTLPMFLGYLFYYGPHLELSFHSAYKFMVLAGFGEEFAFRGFLFGLLYFYCGWGFIPASLISSYFFAAGHLYQAHDVGSAIGIFAFTFLANAGFALFYIVWGNLWMVISLHGFMDLVWDMFPIEDNVTGSTVVNIFRFSTLILAIIITIRKFTPEKRQEFRSSLWRNPVK